MGTSRANNDLEAAGTSSESKSNENELITNRNLSSSVMKRVSESSAGRIAAAISYSVAAQETMGATELTAAVAPAFSIFGSVTQLSRTFLVPINNRISDLHLALKKAE